MNPAQRQFGTTSNEKGNSDAHDPRSHSSRPVGPRARVLVHHGRLHSHPAGRRRHRDPGAPHPGPQRALTRFFRRPEALVVTPSIELGMKPEAGELGIAWGRDLASYDLRSNSPRFSSSAASGAPPLELHPKSSMDGFACPFRSSTVFEYSPRRTAMRDAFRIRSPRQGAVSDLWAAMRGARE